MKLSVFSRVSETARGARCARTPSYTRVCRGRRPGTRVPGICTPGTEHTGRWTTKEHETFLQALKLYGKEWKKVAAMVKTRTVVQTRTHAQKYFQKLQKLRSAGGTVTEDGLRAIDAGMTVPVGPESLGSSSQAAAVRKKGVSSKRPKREGAFGELDDDDLRERTDSLSPVAGLLGDDGRQSPLGGLVCAQESQSLHRIGCVIRRDFQRALTA